MKKKFSNDYWLNPKQKYVEVTWHEKQIKETKELFHRKLDALQHEFDQYKQVSEHKFAMLRKQAVTSLMLIETDYEVKS